MIKIFLQRKTGVVLAEALLAVTLLGVSAIIVGSIVNNAITSTRLSKNYLIAQNLATEAVEAVKNLRDTNWLLDPDSTSSCWLRLDPAVDPSCDSVASVGSNYIVMQREDGQWVLEEKGPDLDLANYEPTQEDYRLYLLVWNEYTPGEYVQYVTTDTGNPSAFYRDVSFLDKTNELTTFVVSVQWKEGAKARKIDREITLYNFY